MRVGEVLVHLQRIGKLDCGLLVLAAGLVSLATIQVLVLAHVGIATASGCEKERERYNQRRRDPGGLCMKLFEHGPIPHL